MTEDQLQAKCWQWLWNTYPQLRGLCWHVPNGGARVLIEAVKFKAMGVLAGVADLHLFFKGELWLFELKVGNNSLSQQQAQWRDKMVKEGAKWFEVRTFEQFKMIVNMIVEFDGRGEGKPKVSN
jgi:hypothetical protein